jgi:hypothetical protein
MKIMFGPQDNQTAGPQDKKAVLSVVAKAGGLDHIWLVN